MDKEEVYTNKAIGIATYLGGPLVGGLFLYKNFKLFDEDDGARNVLIFSFILFFAFFELVLLIPDAVFDKIPRFVIPSIYTGILYYIFKKFQDEKVSNFLASGGRKASGWKIFGVSAIGLLITFSYVVIRVMYIAPFEGEVMVFGSANNNIYYDKEIEGEEVKKLGNFLTDHGYFQSEVSQDINFILVDDIYEIHILLEKKWWADKDIVLDLLYMQEKLSNKILNKNVEIIMLEEGIDGREQMSVNSAYENLLAPNKAM